MTNPERNPSAAFARAKPMPESSLHEGEKPAFAEGEFLIASRNGKEALHKVLSTVIRNEIEHIVTTDMEVFFVAELRKRQRPEIISAVAKDGVRPLRGHDFFDSEIGGSEKLWDMALEWFELRKSESEPARECEIPDQAKPPPSAYTPAVGDWVYVHGELHKVGKIVETNSSGAWIITEDSRQTFESSEARPATPDDALCHESTRYFQEAIRFSKSSDSAERNAGRAIIRLLKSNVLRDSEAMERLNRRNSALIPHEDDMRFKQFCRSGFENAKIPLPKIVSGKAILN